MARKVDHSLLDRAKINKKDEFYTQLADIERELAYYEQHFRNKTVFCNCDDVRKSNFYRYFTENFERLGLKKVICACYRKSDRDLFSDGGADIVVSNPPFSLFREYISQLDRYRKKFLVIGNINAITYKEVFALIRENKAWMGVNMGRGISGFIVPEDYELYGLETKIGEAGERIVSPNNCMWLTNLDNACRHGFIPLTKKYRGNEAAYPKFDNYDAINVGRTRDIPFDYKGVMGVPITFLHRFNPDQFKIVKFRKGNDEKDLRVGGKPTYFRILIQSR